MPVKLIAVDIDGTLVDSRGCITEATQRAVADADRAGVQIALGTGRALDECAEILQLLPQIRYAINCTGASVYDIVRQRELYADPLPIDLVRMLYRRLKPVDCLLEIMSDGHVFVDAPRLEAARHYKTEFYLEKILRSRTPADVEAMLEHWDKPVAKIHLFCRDEAEQRRAWSLVADCDLLIVSSIPVNLEINMPTASKGVGLRKLAQHLGLAQEETMAIGDNVNDLGMLQEAGYPTVMANANPATLPYARYMTASCDDDGVALAIRHVLDGTVEAMRRECP